MMGKRRSAAYSTPFVTDEAPATLEGHTFYGLVLDEGQRAFRSAIWDPSKVIVFCDSVAGTGKTQIAAATANLLVQYGRYDGIVYIAAPTQEQKQGFIKGTIEEKSEPYFEPFYEALDKIGVNRMTALCNDVQNLKNGTAYIECLTHTFLRGCNFERKVVIIDEAQNFYIDELRKVLTRMHDNCKVIVIGHTGQIDLYSNPYRSGLAAYIEHFRGQERAAVCHLTENHRGWLSSFSDQLISPVAKPL